MSGKPARVLSCGVVVVRRAGPEPEYLCLRAYRYWDFPKGQIEGGEAPLEAAVREVEEETTLADLDFRWGHGYRETEVYRGHKVARFYLAESPEAAVSLPVDPALGRPEHHEFRWLPYLEAHRVLGPRLRPILDWAASKVRSGSG